MTSSGLESLEDKELDAPRPDILKCEPSLVDNDVAVVGDPALRCFLRVDWRRFWNQIVTVFKLLENQCRRCLMRVF